MGNLELPGVGHVELKEQDQQLEVLREIFNAVDKLTCLSALMALGWDPAQAVEAVGLGNLPKPPGSRTHIRPVPEGDEDGQG